MPAIYRAPSGYRLGQWVRNQRKAYNASPQRLSPERIADLETLGMIWDDLEEKFAAGLAALTAYHAEHGHARVPKRYRAPSGYRLGQWVADQHRAYSASLRRLSPERIADLEALGVVWSLRKRSGKKTVSQSHNKKRPSTSRPVRSRVRSAPVLNKA